MGNMEAWILRYALVDIACQQSLESFTCTIYNNLMSE